MRRTENYFCFTPTFCGKHDICQRCGYYMHRGTTVMKDKRYKGYIHPTCRELRVIDTDKL